MYSPSRLVLRDVACLGYTNCILRTIVLVGL